MKATISKMDYQVMEDQIKKGFISTLGDSLAKNETFKSEVKLEVSGVYYSSGKFKSNANNNRGKSTGNNKLNLTNNKGEISRCNSCGSKYH